MMRKAIHTGCLAAALSFTFAAPVLAQAQKTPPAQKPAAAVKAPAVAAVKAPAVAPVKANAVAPGKAPAPAASAGASVASPGASEGGGSSGIILLAVVGGLVVLGGGGFVAWKKLSGGGSGGGKDDPILPERKYDWELRLTEEQEKAMLMGVQAYRDAGHSLLFYHREAMIRFYGPYLLVSMHRVTDAFLAAGPAAMADPAGAVRSILAGFLAAESPGVLHLRKEWYPAPIDGLDNLQFTNLCYDVLTCPDPYLEGTQGSGCDEGTGVMELHLEVGGPFNTFCVDLARVRNEVQNARAMRPSDPLIELVRPVLIAMARGQLSGGMWMRGGGTAAEGALVEQIIATSKQRATG